MEEVTHRGNIIEVFQKEVQENGKAKTFEFARRSPGARLIIVSGDNILLTKELRHEVGGYDYRLPGGKVYDSLEEYRLALESGVDINEAAKHSAIKEAYEEAGVEVKDASFFHKSVCGATIIWDLFYFVAKDFVQDEQHLKDGEDIEVVSLDREEVKKMCLDGRISEERSALVLLRYLESL